MEPGLYLVATPIGNLDDITIRALNVLKNSDIIFCENTKNSSKLFKKYSIKAENFLGHSDIAPLRKIDPGEKFPWKKLSKYKIGKWYFKNKNVSKVHPKKMQELFFTKG